MHVDQVMAGVPRQGRCSGHSAEERRSAGSGSFMAKLLGR